MVEKGEKGNTAPGENYIFSELRLRCGTCSHEGSHRMANAGRHD